jgi:predicted alpha/beta hydrolase
MPREATTKRRSRSRPRSMPPAAASSETVDVRTADGWSLRADVDEPAGEPVGVAVLAHAMMARRAEFDRPHGKGLRRWLVERGWRVIAFDFRGHGESGPSASEGGDWSYDDLVHEDLPAIHAFARSRDRKRLHTVLVGHSLGGHVGLAAQGTGFVDFDRIALVAVNVWMPQFDSSPRRWALKRSVLEAVVVACRRVGRFPARTLRVGSDDESHTYFEDFGRFARTGRWESSDGKVDYLAALSNVRVPVLQIVSDGDRWAGRPEGGSLFVDRCGGPRELIRVTRGDDGGPAPNHMGIVTSGRIGSAWRRVEEWMRPPTVAT